MAPCSRKPAAQEYSATEPNTEELWVTDTRPLGTVGGSSQWTTVEKKNRIKNIVSIKIASFVETNNSISEGRSIVQLRSQPRPTLTQF